MATRAALASASGSWLPYGNGMSSASVSWHLNQLPVSHLKMKAQRIRLCWQLRLAETCSASKSCCSAENAKAGKY